MRTLKRAMNDKKYSVYGVSIFGVPTWGIGHSETHLDGHKIEHILPEVGKKPVQIKPQSFVFLR